MTERKPETVENSADMVEIEIPADSPWFAGHFPGAPVFPGIGQLGLVRDAAVSGRITVASVEMIEAHGVRLRRPVEPGDRLVLRLAATGEEGGFRFDLRKGPEVVSQGGVRFGSSSHVDGGPDGGEVELAGIGGMRRSSSMSAGFPPVAELLPHGLPARLLTRVVAAGDGGIEAVARIPGEHPLAAAGSAPGFVGLEVGAQAAAALQALMQPPGAGGPRIGYLVGVRAARLAARIETGRVLRVVAVPAGGAGALAIYEVEVFDGEDEVAGGAEGQAGGGGAGGRRLARATLSTFMTE